MPTVTTYTNNGDGTSTLEIAFTYDTSKVVDFAYDLGKALYNDNSDMWIYVGDEKQDWDDLSSPDQRDHFGKLVRYHLKRYGQSLNANESIEAYEQTLPTGDDLYGGES